MMESTNFPTWISRTDDKQGHSYFETLIDSCVPPIGNVATYNVFTLEYIL